MKPEFCLDCNSGYFFVKDSGACLACIQNCDTCSNNNSCTTCKQSYYLKIDQTCGDCIANCVSCTTGEGCQKCGSGFNLVTVNDKQTCSKVVDPPTPDKQSNLTTILVIVAIVVVAAGAIGATVYFNRRGKQQQGEYAQTY